MTSISRAIAALNHQEIAHQEHLHRVAQNVALAIGSISQFAIEVRPTDLARFRTRLEPIAAQARQAVSDDDHQHVQVALGEELRAYRDSAALQLARLRAELQSAIAAMIECAEGAMTSGGEVEAEVKRDIAQLENAALCEDLIQLRKDLREVTASLAASYEKLVRSNRAVVAQLQDEIRALHSRQDQERKELYTDHTSGAWISQKMDDRVEDLLREDQPFAVALVLGEFGKIEAQTGIRSLREECLRALHHRLEGVVQNDGSVYRWRRDMFAALFELDPSAAAPMFVTLRERLALPYNVQRNGEAYVVHIPTRVEIVERPAGSRREEFTQRVERLAAQLASRDAGTPQP